MASGLENKSSFQNDARAATDRPWIDHAFSKNYNFFLQKIWRKICATRRRTELTQKFRKFDNIHRKGTCKSELSIVKDDLKETGFFV